MPPLRRTLTLANLNIGLNDENQPEKNNPALSFSLPPADPQFIMNNRPPLAILLVQLCTTTSPSIFKPPATTMSLPRKSSPLGSHPYLLPGRPVFPPSVRKPDLYRQALKKSARLVRQAKRDHIHRMEKKALGYVDHADATQGHTSLQNCQS
jgi:hypothetical protein